MMEIFFACVASYLVGSIPSGLILGKGIWNIDLREHGSHNIGATNAWRTIGKQAGILIFLCDLLKGVFGVWVGGSLSGTPLALVLGGVFAIVGHSWSFFLQFKGGKGVATGLGVILSLMPIPALLIFAVLLRLKNTRPGGRAALFLLLYAACQIIWESMLQVGVLRWGFVRVQQVFSAVAVLAALLCAFFRLPQKERRLSELILRITGLIVCCGVIMTMEFALEQKITFLLFMRMDICYLVMALGCAGLILTALPMWRRAYRKA